LWVPLSDYDNAFGRFFREPEGVLSDTSRITPVVRYVVVTLCAIYTNSWDVPAGALARALLDKALSG
jgi:hypothetical protein